MSTHTDFNDVSLTEKNVNDLHALSEKTGMRYDVLETLAKKSVIELRDKTKRLRAFYTYQEQTKDWVLPNAAHNYIAQFKPEDKKRKNKVKASLLHEVDATLWMARLYQAGILPEKVTYERTYGAHLDIPKAHQSIEHLFAAEETHDAHEDFVLSARARLMYEMRKNVKRPASMSEEFLESMIKFHADGTDALTFDYETYSDPSRNSKIKICVYEEGDRQPYTDVLENIWNAIAGKGPDRMGGNIMRFDEIPNTFTFEQHDNYRDETENLFMLRQTLENMQERYPELNDFFGVTNANLSIAYRYFVGALKLHSENPKQHPTPNTFKVNVGKKLLGQAFVGAEFIERDVAPMQALLKNYQALAQRKPLFKEFVTQMEKDLTPYLLKHPETPLHPSAHIDNKNTPRQALA